MTENLKDLSQINDFLVRLNSRLDTYEGYMATRLDELSSEINASSQLAEMAEEGLVRKFAEILEIISAISYKGTGDAPMNAGVELEKVIEVTETAANQIMDAAERITDRLANSDDLNDSAKREAALDDVRNEIQEILIACSFQDLTGQRVRKTLENMQLIEERLSSTLYKLGLDVDSHKGKGLAADITSAKEAKTSSQGDIDSLFD
ncbi:MAG: protein phosphatase CheZ [Rhodospirillales bacterium]|nr:protein phosphatase CheZ [Rhodospirillales bacterium]